MKLFYFNKVHNFGDSINPWFWKHYINSPFQESSGELFVGIGTLLNNRLPENYATVHIMGSGAGYGEFVPRCRDNWQVHCVRGPLTADALGIDRKYAITDPAILFNELVPLNTCKDIPCAFMPHIGIDSPRLKTLVEQLGIVYVSPGEPPQQVVELVNRSERLICSAMHGAILADALRVPWYPVTNSPVILHFKWQDWFESMNIDAELHRIPIIWSQAQNDVLGWIKAGMKEYLFSREIRKILTQNRFILSKNDMLEQRKMELKSVFERFNRRENRS